MRLLQFGLSVSYPNIGAYYSVLGTGSGACLASMTPPLLLKAEQLESWLRFIELWENAIGEETEVVVALDANLDFLTWRSDSLPPQHSSVKLKALIAALFERILPLGITPLVTGATRLERGQPRAGPDHVYTNKPEKLSSIQYSLRPVGLASSLQTARSASA